MTTLALARPSVKLGNPRDSRPAWTDADRWGLGLNDEPRPTAGPEFEPTPEDDAERLGYQLGLDREDAAPPAWFAPGQVRRFLDGLVAGYREWEARLDEMFADAVACGRVTDFDVYANGGVS